MNAECGTMNRKSNPRLSFIIHHSSFIIS